MKKIDSLFQHYQIFSSLRFRKRKAKKLIRSWILLGCFFVNLTHKNRNRKWRVFHKNGLTRAIDAGVNFLEDVVEGGAAHVIRVAFFPTLSTVLWNGAHWRGGDGSFGPGTRIQGQGSHRGWDSATGQWLQIPMNWSKYFCVISGKRYNNYLLVLISEVKR